MKKIIFDDFLPDSGNKFIVEDVAPAPLVSHVNGASSAPALKGFPAIRPEAKVHSHEFQVRDFFDVDAQIYKGPNEPRAEFNFLLSKVLGVVKEVIFAQTVGFFWVNREKRQLVLESRVSDSTSFMTGRRFEIGHDLASKVATTGRPEMITDVNPLSRAELFKYYDIVPELQSFVGVPVYFGGPDAPAEMSQPMGILVADSLAEGAFGEETLALLGRFTKLISGLIKSYTDKYDLILESEVLSSLRKLREHLKVDYSLVTIVHSLAEEISKLVVFDYLTVVLYDENAGAWRVKKVINRPHLPYVTPEQIVDFPRSIVGQAIRQNSTKTRERLSDSLPAFFAGEEFGTHGSFLALPISSLNKCYGSLNLERMENLPFSSQEIQVVTRLAQYSALSLEILCLNEIVSEYVIIDDITGAYSKKFFIQRMTEELSRSDDLGTDLSLLIIQVDHAPELIQRFGPDGFDRVTCSVAQAIRTGVRNYDIVGKVGEGRFGILLADTPANEAYLWAEKIRKNISSHVIDLDGKSFSITLSIGVSGIPAGAQSEDILRNTSSVAQKAIDAGGNSVRVY